MFSFFDRQKWAFIVEDEAKRLLQLSHKTDLQPAFSECSISSLLLANTYIKDNDEDDVKI